MPEIDPLAPEAPTQLAEPGVALLEEPCHGLHRRTVRRLSRKQPGFTLQATKLVDEAWLLPGISLDRT